jgi:serine protease Do
LGNQFPGMSDLRKFFKEQPQTPQHGQASMGSGLVEGIGFAIPINLAKWVAEQLSHGGTVHRARLGVVVQPLSQDLASQFGLKTPAGVLVTEVAPGSPAARVGLKSGDVIVAFAEKTISTPQELQMVVEQTPIGHQRTIVIVCDGKRMELKVSPLEMPGDGKGEGELQDKNSELGSRLDKLGIEVLLVHTAQGSRFVVIRG